MKRQLAYQACYVIAAIAAFTGPARAASIATVTDVVNEGYRTPPGHEEQAAKRADELVQDEALRTDDESSIAVQFVDGSQLSVESDSELVLSDYVFDGAASQGLINLNEGLFHFTSNGKPDQGVRLRTPVATIGVRGTEFLVHVDGDDATVIDVLSGAVEAKPNGTGKSVVCVGGQSILVAGADADAQCGDLGSFSSASGAPDHDRRPEPGHAGQDRERPAPPEKPEPPKPDPEPDPDPDPDPGEEGGGSGITFLFEEEPFNLG
ncbi:MAG TPA: FecR family protein [Dongiaceae bacterium]|nr:FecR family protein [Dongiaceae bacterium]